MLFEIYYSACTYLREISMSIGAQHLCTVTEFESYF